MTYLPPRRPSTVVYITDDLLEGGGNKLCGWPSPPPPLAIFAAPNGHLGKAGRVDVFPRRRMCIWQLLLTLSCCNKSEGLTLAGSLLGAVGNARDSEESSEYCVPCVLNRLQSARGQRRREVDIFVPAPYDPIVLKPPTPICIIRLKHAVAVIAGIVAFFCVKYYVRSSKQG